MTGFWFQLIAMMLALNPSAAVLAADSASRRRQAVVAACLALAILILGAWLATPLVDWLDVAPESFRTAAGIVMAVQGASMVWNPELNYRASSGIAGGLIPLGWPVMVNAGALLATVSFAADTANAQVIGVAAIAVGLTAAVVAVVPAERSRNALLGGARVTGAFLVPAAAAVIVSGVRDV